MKEKKILILLFCICIKYNKFNNKKSFLILLYVLNVYIKI